MGQGRWVGWQWLRQIGSTGHRRRSGRPAVPARYRQQHRTGATRAELSASGAVKAVKAMRALEVQPCLGPRVAWRAARSCLSGGQLELAAPAPAPASEGECADGLREHGCDLALSCCLQHCSPRQRDVATQPSLTRQSSLSCANLRTSASSNCRWRCTTSRIAASADEPLRHSVKRTHGRLNLDKLSSLQERQRNHLGDSCSSSDSSLSFLPRPRSSAGPPLLADASASFFPQTRTDRGALLGIARHSLRTRWAAPRSRESVSARAPWPSRGSEQKR